MRKDIVIDRIFNIGFNVWFILFLENTFVTPDIAAAHKIILILWKENWFLAPCPFRGKCLVWGVAT
jgi:hypothetical protein